MKSKTDWARLKSGVGAARPTPEHPEAEIKHIVRGLVRKGLKPLPTKASISLRVAQVVLLGAETTSGGNGRCHTRASPPRSMPSHASMRKAMSGDMAARPFNTRDNATRDTPNCSAAWVTPRPNAGSTSSHSVRPGWGGVDYSCGSWLWFCSWFCVSFCPPQFLQHPATPTRANPLARRRRLRRTPVRAGCFHRLPIFAISSGRRSSRWQRCCPI